MDIQNSIQKSANTTAWVVLAILLIVIFRMFFYEHGFGTIRAYHYECPDLYVRLSDGRELRAAPCKQDITQGNHIEFTALGLNRMIGSQQILEPVIVHCQIDGWVLDGTLP